MTACLFFLLVFSVFESNGIFCLEKVLDNSLGLFSGFVDSGITVTEWSTSCCIQKFYNVAEGKNSGWICAGPVALSHPRWKNWTWCSILPWSAGLVPQFGCSFLWSMQWSCSEGITQIVSLPLHWTCIIWWFGAILIMYVFLSRFHLIIMWYNKPVLHYLNSDIIGSCSSYVSVLYENPQLSLKVMIIWSFGQI